MSHSDSHNVPAGVSPNSSLNASPNRAPVWPLAVAIALPVLLAGWAVLSISRPAARTFNLFLYLLANLVVFLDLLDFVLRLYFRQIYAVPGDSGYQSATSLALDIGTYTPYQKRLHLRPYALVVSVYNAEDHIDQFLEDMQPYRDYTWMIDDASTDNTCQRIHQAGWRILEGMENRKKPGALWRLVQILPPEIETILVLDPDAVIKEGPPGDLSNLENVIFEFQRSGMAAVCPRLTVRRDGYLARLQALEYCMAFSLGRMSLAGHGINSGISIYRRDALEKAFQEHSLSVYAEDLENSTILLGHGERIYHDARLVVETEGKRTWNSWFSQRVGWAFGLIKVYTERFATIRQLARRGSSAAYQYVIYMGIFNILLLPLKLFTLALLAVSFGRTMDGLFGLGLIPGWQFAEPVYFLGAFAKFTLLALAAVFAAVPRGDRRYVLPAVPMYFFYAHFQIAPTAVGYANWMSLKLWGKRIWGDHYQQDEPVLRKQQKRALAKAAGGS